MVLRVKVGEQRICDAVLMAKGSNKFTQKDAELFLSLSSPIGIAVSNSLKHLELKAIHSKVLSENQELKQQLNSISSVEVVGKNSGLHAIMQRVDEISSTDTTVLINGKTGVGKDVIAHAIQANSLRKKQPFIRVNCGAIPEELLDSELFGHEKGAFTGAIHHHTGRFERADTGTIFLDEVGELSKAAQVRLLRVLQNGELERVGGRETIHINVRVIAATNRSLEKMVESGDFRADLYYRLCVYPIHVPSLGERLEDIPLFVQYFLTQHCQKRQIPVPKIAQGELDKLMQHSWPGNVRELSNVVERALISAKPEGVRFDIRALSSHWAPSENSNNQSSLLTAVPTLDQINRKHIEKTLSLTEGRIQGKDGAAELLDINPHTLRSRMKKLGITT
jgi:transcriptional regulator with GAF, ATPase, and Fis domain